MSELIPLHRLVKPVNDKISAGKDPTKPYVGLEHIETRSPFIRNYGQSEDSISTNSVFKRGDILFGKLRPNLRKCILAPIDGYCSTDILVLRAYEDIYPGFSAKIFQSEIVGAAAEREAIGTKMPRASWVRLRNLKVFCPDIREQERIAHILDNLDTQIQKTEELIAKTETLKKGLLHDLLTRGIDKHGKLRPAPDEAPALYKQSSIGMIPKDWEAAALGQLLSDNGGFIQTGPFGSQLHAEEYVEDGVPVVMPQDMRDIEVCASNTSMITESRAQDLRRHRVQSNDLLFSRRGDLARCSYISISNEGWLCGTGCLLLRPPSDSLDTFWFAHLYKQPLIQSQVLGMAVGSTMVNLNSTILANIRFPYPAIEEQRRISERLRTVSSLVYGEQRTLEKLKMEKEALMDDLLTGRVRVTPILEKKEQAAV